VQKPRRMLQGGNPSSRWLWVCNAAVISAALAGCTEGEPAPTSITNVGSLDNAGLYLAAFRKGLNEAGFRLGQNVAIEYRWAEGQYDRMVELVADLVRSRVAVIAVPGTPPGARAAKAATSTIPIVFGVRNVENPGSLKALPGKSATRALPGETKRGLARISRFARTIGPVCRPRA